MIDVLFIHPGDQKKTYQDLAKEYTAIATPAWTALLANYVRNRGYSTAIYDANLCGWDEQSPKALIEKYNPRLIILMVYGHNPSASTQTMPAAGKIARAIKYYNKEIPIAMGGIHPSALPERTLAEEEIDFVMQGEGAYTALGLLRYLKGELQLKDINGLWFKNDGQVRSNSPAAVVKDLDAELDGYAWDLLPSPDLYRAHNMHCFQEFQNSKTDDFSDVRSPYIAMNTSLGCPYSCHYCCINAIFAKPGIRYWSVEKVVSWVDELVNKYKVKNIRFDDELFILSSERIARFCDQIIERGYDLNIWAYARVDTIDGSLLKKLKRAGVNWICLGIESANAKVRSAVNKNLAKGIQDTVRLIQSYGIYIVGNYMFGLPEDDLGTMGQTFALATELNCEFANFYSVMAYPGSKLFEPASKKGCLPENWAGFSQHSYETMPLPTKYISARQVLKFRDEAFNKYYTNPAYLNIIRDKFGPKVEQHLKKMLEIKIKRKVLGD